MLTHSAATSPPTDDELNDIVAAESAVSTCQVFSKECGPLNAAGGQGDPRALSRQPFYLGINDPFGENPTGAPYTPEVFTVYQNWLHAGSGVLHDGTATNEETRVVEAREAVARGEETFNRRPFVIAGVAGLNDRYFGGKAIVGTCSSCHDTPNVGNHSVAVLMNTGVSDASRRTPDLPLYTFQNLPTGATYRTTDPGQGLITGRWNDLGKFKIPALRGLPARAPYFHDGSAATVEDVINFYDARFQIHYSEAEKRDLAAFLNCL